MATSMSERLLRRALGYLGLCGLKIDTSVERRALELVSKVMAEEAFLAEPIDESTAYTRLMTQLDTRFTLPKPLLPPVTPIMDRGSIGYGDLT